MSLAQSGSNALVAAVSFYAEALSVETQRAQQLELFLKQARENPKLPAQQDHALGIVLILAKDLATFIDSTRADDDVIDKAKALRNALDDAERAGLGAR